MTLATPILLALSLILFVGASSEIENSPQNYNLGNTWVAFDKLFFLGI